MAWLSGSLAGITAGLYALGFVATIGADGLLGIESALNVRDANFYIGRGGNLVMRTLVIGMWPALVIVAIAAAGAWLWRRISHRGAEANARLRRAARAAVLPAVSVAMLALAIAGLKYFVAPALEVRNLLFAREIPAETCGQANSLTIAIYSQDRETLDLWFMGIAAIAGTVAGLALVARTQLLKAGQGVWLSLAAIAGVLMLVELPLAYGMMAVDIAPPPIVLDAEAVPAGDRLRFLGRADGGLLLWLEQERRVLWLGGVGMFKVGPGEPIAPVTCAGAN